MCGRDLASVPGDAYEPHQALFARFDAGFKRTVRTESDVPFDWISQAVELNQINSFHAHPLKGLVDLALGIVIRALAGFRGEKEASRMSFKPGRDSQLRVTVPRGDVNVVNTVAQQHFKGLVCFLLGDSRQGRTSKDRSRALMSGTSKDLLRNHSCLHQ